MDGSIPPMHDSYPIGPVPISHSTDGSYNDNANNNPNTSYGTTMTFQNNNPIPALNQMISVLGGPPQSTHGHLLSPSHTISPTIYSPATPTYVQSPSTSTPHKSSYALTSPSVAEYPSLFGPGQLHSGWNQQASPRNHVPDLNYNLSMANYQQNTVNSASSHHMAPPVNPLGPNVHTPAEPGSLAWLSNCIMSLSSQQRIEIETAYDIWRSDIERQILVVNMYCDWFEHQRRPKKDALLKFYRAKLAPAEDTSRVRGGKGGQGARGGAVGYTCEWPGCSKSFGGRTDRVHEHALTHLNIKMFVCDADKCHASFLRKNELNRHLKSCKLRLLPGGAANTAPTNALFLSMPPSPIASTSRPANERPRHRRQRSARGVSADISPSTSGNDSPNVSTNMNHSFPGFLPQAIAIPQGHFQSQHAQHQMPGPGPGFGDGQMYHGHPTPQQQQQQQQQQHNTLHHGHAHQNQRSHTQHMMGVNTGDMTPMSAYAEQFPSTTTTTTATPTTTTRGLGPGGSPQHPRFDLHGPLSPQHSNLQEGLVVPSHSSPPTPLNDLASSSRFSLSPALSPRNFSVSPPHPPFVYGQPFYHTGSYPTNGNVSGYVYYPPNQQQPPQQ